MPMLNTACAICEEEFQNSDIIHSTYCGHVFHKNCLDNWKTRRNSCPSCQRDYQSTFDHQLFLNFDDQEKDSPEFQELKLKLQSSQEKNDQLQDQINEIEFNFLQLQEQYTTSEQLKKDMEEQVKRQNYNDENFLGLQRQYTESTEYIKDLKKLIEELNDENEKNCKELDLKRIEIASLKNLSPGSYDTSSDNRVKILEQKIKHLENELKTEIANGTQLSIEKMKLESCIAAGKSNFPKNREKPENIKKGQSNETERSVIIDNFPEHRIIYPLEKLVIDLGAKMYLPIRIEDIFKVEILDKSKYKQKSNNNVAIFVKFKENDMKIKFLANKNVLKSSPITNSYILREYTEDAINSLFIYAEEKLKNSGFAEVFCKNNRVFVKKRTNSKPLQICNRRHVDTFIKRHMEESLEASKDDKPVNSINHKVDENFYQI